MIESFSELSQYDLETLLSLFEKRAPFIKLATTYLHELMTWMSQVLKDNKNRIANLVSTIQIISGLTFLCKVTGICYLTKIRLEC